MQQTAIVRALLPHTPTDEARNLMSPVDGAARSGPTSLFPLACQSAEFAEWLGGRLVACLPARASTAELVAHEERLCERAGIRVATKMTVGVPFELLPPRIARSRDAIHAVEGTLAGGLLWMPADPPAVVAVVRFALGAAVVYLARVAGERRHGTAYGQAERKDLLRCLLASSAAVNPPPPPLLVLWKRERAAAEDARQDGATAAAAAAVQSPYAAWTAARGSSMAAAEALLPLCVRQVGGGHVRPSNQARLLFVLGLRDAGWPKSDALVAFREVLRAGVHNVVDAKGTFEGLWASSAPAMTCTRLAREFALCPSATRVRPAWSRPPDVVSDMEDMAIKSGRLCLYQCCERRGGVHDLVASSIRRPTDYATLAVERGAKVILDLVVE